MNKLDILHENFDIKADFLDSVRLFKEDKITLDNLAELIQIHFEDTQKGLSGYPILDIYVLIANGYGVIFKKLEKPTTYAFLRYEYKKNISTKIFGDIIQVKTFSGVLKLEPFSSTHYHKYNLETIFSFINYANNI
jgi:acetamidase/formamidase